MTEPDFDQAIADALGFQSAETSTTARKKTNHDPVRLLEAKRIAAKIAKPAVRREVKFKDS